MNIVNIEKKYFITVLCLVLFFSFALEATASPADERIKEQNEVLEDVFRQNYEDTTNNENPIELNPSREIRLTRKSILSLFLELSLFIRRFSVIIFALLMILYAVILSSVGAKSIKKRRKYTFLIVNMTILFLVLINLPILIILFNSNEGKFTGDFFIDVLYSFLHFLQQNSLVIASVMVITAIDKKVLNVSDIPDREHGNFLLVGSLAMIAILNLLPKFLTYMV